MATPSVFKVGDLVQVKSETEILRTLDAQGCTTGVPFMPEMRKYCGKQFRVYKGAHKTCFFDMSNNMSDLRELDGAVHLVGVRCDGSSHGHCQADCLLFWKDEWLQKAEPDGTSAPSASHDCLLSETTAPRDPPAPGPQASTASSYDMVYACQATMIPKFTRHLSVWKPQQYVNDMSSGNVTLSDFPSPIIFRIYNSVINAGIGAGPLLRWLYDRFHKVWRGIPYPDRRGAIAAGAPTPPGEGLNLQPGDYVRVKTYAQILQTIDERGRNRGLAFSQEMVPYCGGIFRIRSRVSRIIDEGTGKMLRFKTDCYILEGSICRARYMGKMMFCPRSTYPYWREIWLERAAAPDEAVEASLPRQS